MPPPKPNLRLEDRYNEQQVDTDGDGDLGTSFSVLSISSASSSIYTSSAYPSESESTSRTQLPQSSASVLSLVNDTSSNARSRKSSLSKLRIASASASTSSFSEFDTNTTNQSSKPHTNNARLYPGLGVIRSATLPNAVPSISSSESQIRTSKNEHGANSSSGDTLKAELALELDPAVLVKIRRWILGIAVVNFDIDQGPVIAVIYPPLTLEPHEAANIAFSSFPDSPQFEQGSQIHSFRMRMQGLGRSNSFPSAGGDDTGATTEANGMSTNTRGMQDGPSAKDTRREDGEFIYGFSYFTQKRVEGSRRGYEQRSTTLLTSLPYPAFFTAISAIFGPMFEDQDHLVDGVRMLEAALGNIGSWPPPTPGSTLEIGFLGTVLNVEIPHGERVQYFQPLNVSGNGKGKQKQQLGLSGIGGEVFDPRVHILASSPPLLPPPILLFAQSLSHLWSIWECVVLSEPILVFGRSAEECSSGVWWLRELGRGITLALDIRPYFTIHDKDFSVLINKNEKVPPKPGLMLGVTNPYFLKGNSGYWPHVLSLGSSRVGGVNAPNTPNPIPSSAYPYTPIPTSTPTPRGGPSHTPSTPIPISASVYTPAPTPRGGAGPGPPPGWMTRTHKRYISKDRVLLKQLEEACRSGVGERERIEASLALRLHFCSRTNEILIPLTRYLHTLIPTPSEVAASHTPPAPASTHSGVNSNSNSSVNGLGDADPNRNRPSPRLRLKPFNSVHFFASLKVHGSTLPFRSSRKMVEFYDRWLKTPAFGLWLAQQENIVQDVLNDTANAVLGLGAGVRRGG